MSEAILEARRVTARYTDEDRDVVRDVSLARARCSRCSATTCGRAWARCASTVGTCPA